MIGFKATRDLKCRDTQFEIGGEYTINGTLELCKNGFHFCKNVGDVFRYYMNDAVVVKVEAFDVIDGDDKSCCRTIKILELLNGNYDNYWFKDGKLHREDGPAVENRDYKAWYLNGLLHREDGPAVEDDGRKIWYLNNLLHREDGPAIEEGDFKEWWINGIRQK